jgi:hypothetical protein
MMHWKYFKPQLSTTDKRYIAAQLVVVAYRMGFELRDLCDGAALVANLNLLELLVNHITGQSVLQLDRSTTGCYLDDEKTSVLAVNLVRNTPQRLPAFGIQCAQWLHDNLNAIGGSGSDGIHHIYDDAKAVASLVSQAVSGRGWNHLSMYGYSLEALLSYPWQAAYPVIPVDVKQRYLGLINHLVEAATDLNEIDPKTGESLLSRVLWRDPTIPYLGLLIDHGCDPQVASSIFKDRLAAVMSPSSSQQRTHQYHPRDQMIPGDPHRISEQDSWIGRDATTVSKRVSDCTVALNIHEQRLRQMKRWIIGLSDDNGSSDGENGDGGGMIRTAVVRRAWQPTKQSTTSPNRCILYQLMPAALVDMIGQYLPWWSSIRVRTAKEVQDQELAHELDTIANDATPTTPPSSLSSLSLLRGLGRRNNDGNHSPSSLSPGSPVSPSSPLSPSSPIAQSSTSTSSIPVTRRPLPKPLSSLSPIPLRNGLLPPLSFSIPSLSSSSSILTSSALSSSTPPRT